MKRRSLIDTDENRKLLDDLGIEYGVGVFRLKLYVYITNADFAALKELITQK